MWDDLGSKESDVSLAATNQLYRALQHDDSLTQDLTQRLAILPQDSEARAQKWLHDLDARKYAIRENASRMLKAMVEQVRPQLERELEACSQEAKWRLRKILQVAKRKPNIASISGRRQHRVILALELCGNLAALDFLQQITQKSNNPNLVESAETALRRLADAGK